MIVVVDSSAAVSVALQRVEAGAFSRYLSEAEAVYAPELLIAEVANVFWKYYRLEDMPMTVCEAACRHALELVDDFISLRELALEAFALACQTQEPVYDMLFLVLARRENATLLTLDKKLAKLSNKQGVKCLTD